jgi:hypothetical protein
MGKNLDSVTAAAGGRKGTVIAVALWNAFRDR